MRSVTGRGCARGLAVGALLGLAAYDLSFTASTGRSAWPAVLVLGTGLAAVLWPVARRPRWLTPQLRTAAPAVLSLLYSAGAILADHAELFGPGEIVILLTLTFIAVRHCPQPWAAVCGVLDGLALLALPARYFHSVTDDNMLLVTTVGLVLVGAVAGFAGYLRSLDYRRTVAVTETRRAERLAIAADLHDFVAHHVTGILVQTQVARMMATSGPADLDPVLSGIERAATEALASMRRTVGVLRDTGPDAADRRPAGDLAAVAELVEGFASPVQKVTLRRDPALPDDLPHEVQAAAFRVVQEALTNVRRHAADAPEVTVGLRRAGRRLEVTVTDDGRGGTQLPAAAHGGGFGLVGLTERVTALGGELRAGPRAGGGWEVRAVFPAGRS
ncbi:sensor histidine kinase [Streptomyces sp. MBT62]|uniref:sensor histidine kinase n=1 Tax=Streptomyces sp. MBT62 TaxID=2800410 RepID=UPI0019096AD8|nr:histidine kinase [Streptomyces sp. MBT62]MBK3565229.1 sensor histidine kinase [Streptomyces sp. MBT62]